MYFRPNTLEEAVSLIASGGQVLAGGTDFYPALGERLPLGRVIDITAVANLRGIFFEPDWIKIGGLTTWTDLIRTPLPTAFDALKAAAREIGSVQIQNRGTVAGNLCNASPAADGVPPLLALDAEIELTSVTGSRRVRLQDFITGNRKTQKCSDELLTVIWVPRRLENAVSAFLKLGARKYLVISISMIAVAMQTDRGRVAEARVAVGSCSAKALRLTELERALVGTQAKEVGGIVKPAHLSVLSPIDDGRATAEYRRDASFRLVIRALEKCVHASDGDRR